MPLGSCDSLTAQDREGRNNILIFRVSSAWAGLRSHAARLQNNASAVLQANFGLVLSATFLRKNGDSAGQHWGERGISGTHTYFHRFSHRAGDFRTKTAG